MTENIRAKKINLSCPYCDKEIAEASFPYCEPCRKTEFYCPKCHQTVPRGKDVCPKCGTKIK